MRVYIGGCHGAGKTTLLTEFQLRHPEFCCYSGSILIMSELGLQTRDDLKRIEPAELEKAAYRAICKFYQSYGNLIIDGHFFLTDLDRQYIDLFVLLQASVDNIITRRESDSLERNERPFNPLDVANELKEVKSRALSFARKFGFHFYIVDNNGPRVKTLSCLESIIDLKIRP